MNSTKQEIMNEIENNVPIFRKVSNIQYRIRCVLCGDSDNPRDSHMYLKCSYDPNEPILYNCFKCNSKGMVNKHFLSKLGIKTVFDMDRKYFNRIPSIKKTSVDVLTGQPIPDSDQVGYISYRLGDGFSIDDYERFKVIWDMSAILPYITDVRIANTLPSNSSSISFLSDDKSTILTRYFHDGVPRWKKIKLFPSENKAFYTIKTTLDIFTSEVIEVNIAEGIFDILSVYKNFPHNNSVHIATLGSNYLSGIDYAINKGLIGSNIVVNVYIDSDIDEKRLRHQLKDMKWLFGQINIRKNINYEDFGITIDKIKMFEYQI